MSLLGNGSLFHVVKIGGRLSPLETCLMYSLPFFMCASEFRAWLLWNAACQLALFVPVVQLPAFITGHMAYVDIGWPIGLVLLALNCMVFGNGFHRRRLLVGGCMLLHGARMAMGALFMFYPYKWKEDLPRYAYAKLRFLTQDGMSPNLWPLKMQHDTLQQAFANSFVLAAPLVLCAFNESPALSTLEIIGSVLWALSWAWESIADMQKLAFLAECKRAKQRYTVLGLAPFSGRKYWLWTLCRHPNYFGEWMAWNAFVVMALPSFMSLNESAIVKGAFALSLFYTSRMFYDCLNYWTGAEPAEYFSVQKRERYREYQRQTRMFFPFELPFVDHCRKAGWPRLEVSS